VIATQLVRRLVTFLSLPLKVGTWESARQRLMHVQAMFTSWFVRPVVEKPLLQENGV
jgi:hypothetical protein